MKQWISPEINELDLKDTSWGHGGWVNNGNWNHGGWVNNGNWSGNGPVHNVRLPGQDDLGGCSNPFHEGNGIPYEDAVKDNPFWDTGALS